MKMLKKAASVALASALVLSMAACGSSGGSDGGSSDADTFKIGGIGPTTGDNAIYGTAVKNGIQLAVDEINEAGGIMVIRSSISLRTTSLILKNQSMRTIP